MEKKRILEVCKLTKKWEELIEEIKILEKSIKTDLSCALVYSYRRDDLILYLSKEEIEFILNNRKARLQELEEEWETFIKE